MFKIVLTETEWNALAEWHRQRQLEMSAQEKYLEAETHKTRRSAIIKMLTQKPSDVILTT